MYQVIAKEKIKKYLKNIPPRDAEKILDIFVLLENNPTPYGYKKLAGYPNFYRIRQRDYRIIYKIDNEKKTIYIAFLSHRKDVYRNLN